MRTCLKEGSGGDHFAPELCLSYIIFLKIRTSSVTCIHFSRSNPVNALFCINRCGFSECISIMAGVALTVLKEARLAVPIC